MVIKELRHSVQAVISTGNYENLREFFEVMATLKEGENADEAMLELQNFNHARLKLAVNQAKADAISEKFSNIRFYDKDGKRFPSVTSIIATEIKIPDFELVQYGSRGTVIHKLSELYLDTGIWVNPEDIVELKEDMDILKGGNLQLDYNACSHKEWFAKYGSDIEVLDTEVELYNDEHMFAGRADAIIIWKGKQKAILDFKTGSNHDFRQLAAYASCHNGIESLIIAPCGVCDNKQGYFNVKVSEALTSEFKAFLKARTAFKRRFGV